MDFDDARPKPQAPLDELEREDLSMMSVEELEERRQRLAGEITRIEAALEKKGASRTAAEKFFGKPAG